MKTTALTLLFFLSLFITACNEKPDCFKGTGSLTSEERTATSITRIELLCNADVIIHPDTITRIKVTTGANLIDKIETDVDGTVLKIRNKNRCNWVRSFNPLIQVEVWTDDLTSILTDNSDGDITFTDTLHTYEFRFDSYASLGKYYVILDSYIATLAMHNGPPDFYGEGKITVAYYYNSGLGKMDFRNILTDKIYMNNRGTNDMYVYATVLLEAQLEESGNIYYRGHPALKTEITGSGSILPLQ